MNNSSEFIKFAIDKGVLQFGKFTLKSGRVSPYFFNAGLFNDGQSLDAVSKFYAQAIVDSNIEFNMLFGPAYKGIPLATAVSMTLMRDYQVNSSYAFNRKEIKQYGDGGKIVGAPLRGKVLIIDDVITAGTAIHEAVNIIRDLNAQPVAVAIAFDRQERGTTEGISAVHEVEQQLGIKVISVTDVSKLIEHAEAEQLYAEHLPALREYFQKHKCITI